MGTLPTSSAATVAVLLPVVFELQRITDPKSRAAIAFPVSAPADGCCDDAEELAHVLLCTLRAEKHKVIVQITFKNFWSRWLIKCLL
jgi:hypothetical protein